MLYINWSFPVNNGSTIENKMFQKLLKSIFKAKKLTNLNLFPIAGTALDFCPYLGLDFSFQFKLIGQNTLQVSRQHSCLIWKNDTTYFQGYYNILAKKWLQ